MFMIMTALVWDRRVNFMSHGSTCLDSMSIWYISTVAVAVV